jgi:protein-tyrosine phosphatase
MVELYSRHIEIESVINFRDLGGYRNRDGRIVAWRRIFRSGDFRHITGADITRIKEEIGLHTVIDLRTAEETEIQGSGLLAETGIRHYNIPFIGGGDSRAEQERIYRECTNMGEFYLQLVRKEIFGKKIAEAIKIIAEPANHPLVFHCAVGKDRTGILSAILLSILDVEDAIIIEDYTLSAPAIKRLLISMVKDPTSAEFVKHVPDYFWDAAPESMEVFLSSMRREYVSIADYLIKHGVKDSQIQSLRKTLLT